MSVNITQPSDDSILVNNKQVIKDSNGNWIAKVALSSTELKTFQNYVSSL